MVWEIVLLVLCVLIAVLLVIFRNTLFVKKYWRYALILIPFAFVAILLLVMKIKSGKPPTSGELDPLAKGISQIKDKLQEANMVSVIEVSAAKAKDQATLDQLAKVRQIDDPSEKTKQLGSMFDKAMGS